MHYIIAYLPYDIQMLQEFRPVDLQIEFVPSFWFTEKPMVFSECEVGRSSDALYVTFRRYSARFLHFLDGKALVDKIAKMTLNLSRD